MVGSANRPSCAETCRGRSRSAWWLLPLLAVAAIGGGCTDSSTTPPPPAVRIGFQPVADALTLGVGQTALLQVTIENASDAKVSFWRGTTLLSQNLQYTYQRQQVGADTIRASAEAGGTSAEKTWRIWVDGGFGDRPPPVPDLAVTDGSDAGCLRVSWNNAPASLGPRPFQSYLVGARFDGALTENDWASAQILDVVPYSAAVVGYVREYCGLPEGAQAQVAVRVLDTGGVLSPLGDVRAKRVAADYRLSGVVRDPDGQPLPGLVVSVGSDPKERTVTADGGAFVLPDTTQYASGFLDTRKYVLKVQDETQSNAVYAFYDFQSDTLSAASAYPLAIMMIPALKPYGDPLGEPLLGAACEGLYDGQFLNFFRSMTRSQYPRYTLNTWDHYPVTVWIRPAYSDSGGFDLAPWARRAVSAWNNRLGEDYYTEIADSAAANVVVVFRDPGSGLLGITRIIVPTGNHSINEVVPVKMQVLVEEQLRTPAVEMRIVLHELGHALCMGAHSACNATSSPHLMVDGSRDVDLDDPESAISDEEALTVRLLRYLPQGCDMRHYILD